MSYEKSPACLFSLSSEVFSKNLFETACFWPCFCLNWNNAAWFGFSSCIHTSALIAHYISVYKCKHHNYHPKIILHNKFYLNRIMGKIQNRGVKLGGWVAEFREMEFWIKKCWHNKYHPKMNWHTKFYLNHKMKKYSNLGGGSEIQVEVGGVSELDNNC